MATSRHQHQPESAYTSPATRGRWLRVHFLGVQPPNPFPGAQPVKPELPITPQTRTLPLNPCVTCHQNFFPLGYALENFDPIGRWRDKDAGQPIDASTTLPGGIAVSGPAGLREALLSRPELFVSTFVEKLMVYALGRRLEAEDMPTVRRIVRDAAREDYRFGAIVLGIVRSDQFQQKARFTSSGTQTVADARESRASTGVSN